MRKRSENHPQMIIDGQNRNRIMHKVIILQVNYSSINLGSMGMVQLYPFNVFYKWIGGKLYIIGFITLNG